jgi:tRNA1(Val) A37 N6-methylase TrmN6
MLDNSVYVLNKRLHLSQAEGGFRSSIDAVLLAAACPIQAGQSLLDIGCGVGTAGLCVLKRVPGTHLTGIDVQEDHIEIAAQNAKQNEMQAHFKCADVRDYVRHENNRNAQFDHMICNPPYNEANSHLRSPSDAKALAMGHGETTLEDWIECVNRNLKSGGSFTMIHKADMIDKIILAFDGRFGDVEIFPLWPRAGVAAKRVIVRALKGRKTPATIHAGLVLHQENGDYTQDAEDILRGMKPLMASG